MKFPSRIRNGAPFCFRERLNGSRARTVRQPTPISGFDERSSSVDAGRARLRPVIGSDVAGTMLTFYDKQGKRQACASASKDGSGAPIVECRSTVRPGAQIHAWKLRYSLARRPGDPTAAERHIPESRRGFETAGPSAVADREIRINTACGRTFSAVFVTPAPRESWAADGWRRSAGRGEAFSFRGPDRRAASASSRTGRSAENCAS